MTRKVVVNGIEFGGDKFVVIAGPCSIESESHLLDTGSAVKKSGASLLRGGIWKMRTSSESFQGLGNGALSFIPSTLNKLGIGLISEITDPRQIEILNPLVSAYQVGSRNMHNYALLTELGKQNKPVLLKRGFGALIDEWIKAAGYIEKEGNQNIILCERGIRTFEKATRNTLDINAVVYAKKHSPYPVIVDPSHAVGISELVPDVALAAVASGCDGLIVEVHPHPKDAKSDGDQALNYAEFDLLMGKVRKVLIALEKKSLHA
ncbi:MAG: 3-deoxy-7-phosphoheptulonate synthase [Pseudobdellovibrionaceae bacterium]